MMVSVTVRAVMYLAFSLIMISNIITDVSILIFRFPAYRHLILCGISDHFQFTKSMSISQIISVRSTIAVLFYFLPMYSSSH